MQQLKIFIGERGKAVNTIIVNSALCIGCGACYRSCFVDVIRWNEKKKRPEFPYLKECAQCCHCEVFCPQKALKVVPDFDSWRFPREVVTTRIR